MIRKYISFEISYIHGFYLIRLRLSSLRNEIRLALRAQVHEAQHEECGQKAGHPTDPAVIARGNFSTVQEMKPNATPPAMLSLRGVVPRASDSKYCSVLGTGLLGASREPFWSALIQAFVATASDTMSDTGLMSVFRETRAGSVVSMTKVSLVT